MSVPWVDDELRSLAGVSIDARASDGRKVTYRIDHPLGEGGTGVAFMAIRSTEDGDTPHVVKIFRPTLLLKAPEIAEVSKRKEQGAMKRLNERVPPSPYIVRMTDAGELPVTYKDAPLSLPWIAAEYVNGGPEGTTLTERITRSVEATGVGFDPERTLRLLRCIIEGLTAIHECGVIHRDIKPDNVLLCGFGNDEVAKITDFGVARAQGFEVTFGPQPIGTIGYAAPEQLGLIQAPTTEATDVFALGVLVYRVLTADEYFRRIGFAQLAVRKDGGPDPRPHLKDAPRLHPEIARSPGHVEVLDQAIRKATSVRPENRFPNARAFFGALEAPLRQLANPQTAKGRRSATRERLRTIMLEAAGRTNWTTRHRPGDERLLRSIAWEPDGRALAVGREGLFYWDGQSWFHVPAPQNLPLGTLQFSHRVEAGRFLVGGSGGVLMELSESGWSEISPMGDPSLVFERAAGTLDGTILLAGSLAGAAVLYVAEQRAWKTAIMIPGCASVNGIAQLDETRWALVGRAGGGQAYLAVYDSSRHRISPFAPPGPRPLLAVASDLEGNRGAAFAVGPGGLALAIRADGEDIGLEVENVTSTRDLSAVAIDPAGVAWAIAQGRVLKRFTVGSAPSAAQSSTFAKWETVHNYEWLVPAIGMLAAGGGVFAATVDGAVLEGRDERVQIGSIAPPTKP
ncbi:MAG: serine/threonine-protein kinase [Polyangiales bacterium]